MPTLNNGKKKESHAEAELRRDLKKVRCLQRKMGMITFPRRRDFYNIKKTYGKVTNAGTPPAEAIRGEDQKH